MDQLTDFSDSRMKDCCVFCGERTETRDHVPSKVFLDEPYPTNLPVVPACKSCNERFSLDEEYVACLIECTLSGSVKPDGVEREKIKRILEKKPALVSKLEMARHVDGDDIAFSVKEERVGGVVLKLAQGHSAYELGTLQIYDQPTVAFMPFPSMPLYSIQSFGESPKSALWPEVGSRGMQRMAFSRSLRWVEVQPGRYRYLAFVEHDKTTIRIVLSEYLACEVVWT